MKKVLAAVLAVPALASCGGGGLAKVSGTVSGLTPGTAMTLQINGGQTVVVASDSFTFPDTLNAEQNYTITVRTQPLRGYCTVDNPTGVVDRNGSDIKDIHVTCVPAQVITVSVNGVPSGATMTLKNDFDNATKSETVGLTGTGSQTSVTFPTSVPSGKTYAVSVVTAPTGRTCTITSGNGSGTVGTADIAIVMTCS
jgi:hypothetical protein